MARFAGVGLVLGTLMAAGCSIDIHGQGTVIREDKRFSVTADPDLTLQTFDGSVQVRSWDRPEVLVEIERRAMDAEAARALEVVTNQTGNRITIDAPESSRRRVQFGRGDWDSVSYVVSVPRRLTLRVVTRDGAIEAREIDGDIRLESGDGSIRGVAVQGRVSAHSGDGAINLTDARGEFDVQSGDGSVRLAGRFEGLRVQTGDGAVNVDVNDGSEMKSDWSIFTGDGSIRLQVPRQFDAALEADTGDGSVRADGVSEITSRRRGGDDDGGSLRARFGRGGRKLSVRSGDGAITVGTH